MFDYSTGILLGVAWLTCGLHTFILKCYRNRREIYTDHSNYMSAGGNNTIYALGMLSVIIVGSLFHLLIGPLNYFK